VVSRDAAAALPPVDVPPVGEGLLHLGRLVGGPLHRVALHCLRLGERCLHHHMRLGEVLRSAMLLALRSCTRR
jgi:hypothetical protein